MSKKIGVLTSGGDCPGLNAVLRGVVRAASNLAWEVIGFKDGFEGLLAPRQYETLTLRSTAGIMHLGGTILGTTNKGHFVAKVGEGSRTTVLPEIVEQARQTLKELEIEALIVIGGDGSLTTAQQLFEEGFPMIGVPKTIDNDLEATAMTFGFDSAVACVADALDRLHTTATSHKRVMVIEVMGRHAGWIALYGGLAGGGDIILLPEIPFDHEKVAAAVRQREADGCLSTLIVVAEGARAVEGKKVARSVHNGENKLGGIGDIVAANVARAHRQGDAHMCARAPSTWRSTDDSRPDSGTRFGVKAVDLIHQGQFGYMVSYQNYQVLGVPIANAVHKLRLVSPDSQMVQTARAVGITFGD